MAIATQPGHLSAASRFQLWLYGYGYGYGSMAAWAQWAGVKVRFSSAQMMVCTQSASKVAAVYGSLPQVVAVEQMAARMKSMGGSQTSLN